MLLATRAEQASVGRVNAQLRFRRCAVGDEWFLVESLYLKIMLANVLGASTASFRISSNLTTT